MASGKDEMMMLKIFGALIVIAGCGGCGLAIALSHKRESVSMQQLIVALDFMHCELQYRLTPLPRLCRMVSSVTKGQIKCFFTLLATELEQQICPHARTCVGAALSQCKAMPQQTRELLCDLGKTLGIFNLEGQLKSIEALRELTENKLKEHNENQDIRIRSYQTLGLCAGAAIVILFI